MLVKITTFRCAHLLIRQNKLHIILAIDSCFVTPRNRQHSRVPVPIRAFLGSTMCTTSVKSMRFSKRNMNFPCLTYADDFQVGRKRCPLLNVSLRSKSYFVLSHDCVTGEKDICGMGLWVFHSGNKQMYIPEYKEFILNYMIMILFSCENSRVVCLQWITEALG